MTNQCKLFTFCSHIIESFHAACSLGLADVVPAFLSEYKGDDLITKKGADGGLNALQIATMNKRSRVVQILLERYHVCMI